MFGHDHDLSLKAFNGFYKVFFRVCGFSHINFIFKGFWIIL
jgi:hypothetical protein